MWCPSSLSQEKHIGGFPTYLGIPCSIPDLGTATNWNKLGSSRAERSDSLAGHSKIDLDASEDRS